MIRRTARGDTSGSALSLVSEKEMEPLAKVEKYLVKGKFWFPSCQYVQWWYHTVVHREDLAVVRLKVKAQANFKFVHDTKKRCWP